MHVLRRAAQSRPRRVTRQRIRGRDGPVLGSETCSRSRRSRWWWRSRRAPWRSRTHSWSSRGASVARSRGPPVHARCVRRPAAAPGRGMRLAVLDARPRPAFRRLAGRPDDGQRHRRRAGGAAVRARRRPGGVRAAGGPPTRPGRHDRRRAGEHARRHRDDRGPGRPRVPDDRGDPEGRVVRQAGLDVAPDGQGGRRPAHVRADVADRAVQGRERPGALRPEADVLGAADEGRGRAVCRRRRSGGGS